MARIIGGPGSFRSNNILELIAQWSNAIQRTWRLSEFSAGANLPPEQFLDFETGTRLCVTREQHGPEEFFMHVSAAIAADTDDQMTAMKRGKPWFVHYCLKYIRRVEDREYDWVFQGWHKGSPHWLAKIEAPALLN